MPFSLEQDQPRLRFENNPLKTVVWQLRFPTLLIARDEAVVARFQAALRDEYPIAERPANQISFVAAGSSVSAGSSEATPWTFHDAEHNWIVGLHPDFVSLETKAYTQFEDFARRLEVLLQATEETVGLQYVNRLGLRYVDHIIQPGAASPADFARLLNDELIGVVAGDELSPLVIDAIQQIRLRHSDAEMAIRHGYVGEKTRLPEAPFYLIDIDAFDPEPRPYDRGGCLDRTWRFKRFCWNFFRQSVRDELVEALEPVEIHA